MYHIGYNYIYIYFFFIYAPLSILFTMTIDNSCIEELCLLYLILYIYICIIIVIYYINKVLYR